MGRTGKRRPLRRLLQSPRCRMTSPRTRVHRCGELTRFDIDWEDKRGKEIKDDAQISALGNWTIPFF